MLLTCFEMRGRLATAWPGAPFRATAHAGASEGHPWNAPWLHYTLEWESWNMAMSSRVEQLAAGTAAAGPAAKGNIRHWSFDT